MFVQDLEGKWLVNRLAVQLLLPRLTYYGSHLLADFEIVQPPLRAVSTQRMHAMLP
jgi:hypothetical protein